MPQQFSLVSLPWPSHCSGQYGRWHLQLSGTPLQKSLHMPLASGCRPPSSSLLGGSTCRSFLLLLVLSALFAWQAGTYLPGRYAPLWSIDIVHTDVAVLFPWGSLHFTSLPNAAVRDDDIMRGSIHTWELNIHRETSVTCRVSLA